MSSNDNERKKGPGRPVNMGNKGRQVFSGKCDVRLSAEENAALTRLADQYEVTRSDVMRRALKDYVRWNEGKE